MPGEFAGGQYRMPGFAGQLFKPRRQDHARADTGEIEPVAAADIAVQHLADMQGEAKALAIAAPDPGKSVGCGNLRPDLAGCRLDNWDCTSDWSHHQRPDRRRSGGWSRWSERSPVPATGASVDTSLPSIRSTRPCDADSRAFSAS
jgi:hypothetical protein